MKGVRQEKEGDQQGRTRRRWRARSTTRTRGREE